MSNPSHFVSGLPETPCGAGSTLEATKEIREAIPHIVQRYNLKLFLDVPCGDGNWMSQVNLPQWVNYLGIDCEPLHIMAARQRSPCRMFLCADVLFSSFSLPRCDLLLCRDFLQHLYNAEIDYFLAKAIPAADYYLLTSWRNTEPQELEGSYRQVNLLRPPYSFPPPLLTVPDGERDLCLWSALQLVNV